MFVSPGSRSSSHASESADDDDGMSVHIPLFFYSHCNVPGEDEAVEDISNHFELEQAVVATGIGKKTAAIICKDLRKSDIHSAVALQTMAEVFKDDFGT